jgi:hypothetical protein
LKIYISSFKSPQPPERANDVAKKCKVDVIGVEFIGSAHMEGIL